MVTTVGQPFTVHISPRGGKFTSEYLKMPYRIFTGSYNHAAYLTIIKDINHFVNTQNWYAFDSLYGTSEEKAFVRMLGREIEGKYKSLYDDIYLIRNEGHFSIYNFSDGQTFQPDFVLFMKEKNGRNITYQLFIEPKGKHITPLDKWKKDFLKEIKEEFGDKLLRFDYSSDYRLVGLPFYNNDEENIFRETLDSALNIV